MVAQEDSWAKAGYTKQISTSPDVYIIWPWAWAPIGERK